MVQVLEQNSGSKEATCSNCASRLRYMPSEVFTKKVNWDYLGDYDIARMITCPVCGKHTQIK